VSEPSATGAPGICVREREVGIIEVAALRGAAAVAREFGRGCGEVLPDFGRVATGAAQLALCVRPGRWLLLDPRPQPMRGAHAARWREGCVGSVVVTDLSSALWVFAVSGIQVRQMLARGCRLDLDPQVFAAGSAAATVMAQVPVILAALSQVILLLTPASTAQHFKEWLEVTSGPFGRSDGVGLDAVPSGETVERYL
jgi:heterotetrameric sarcosine oxidase gamma subunit